MGWGLWWWASCAGIQRASELHRLDPSRGASPLPFPCTWCVLPLPFQTAFGPRPALLWRPASPPPPLGRGSIPRPRSTPMCDSPCLLPCVCPLPPPPLAPTPLPLCCPCPCPQPSLSPPTPLPPVPSGPVHAPSLAPAWTTPRCSCGIVLVAAGSRWGGGLQSPVASRSRPSLMAAPGAGGPFGG